MVQEDEAGTAANGDQRIASLWKHQEIADQVRSQTNGV
jgi:hypothetical protein